MNRLINKTQFIPDSWKKKIEGNELRRKTAMRSKGVRLFAQHRPYYFKFKTRSIRIIRND